MEYLYRTMNVWTELLNYRTCNWYILCCCFFDFVDCTLCILYQSLCLVSWSLVRFEYNRMGHYNNLPYRWHASPLSLFPIPSIYTALRIYLLRANDNRTSTSPPAFIPTPPTPNRFQYFEVVAKPDVLLVLKRLVYGGRICSPSHMYFRLKMTNCTTSVWVN